MPSLGELGELEEKLNRLKNMQKKLVVEHNQALGWVRASPYGGRPHEVEIVEKTKKKLEENEKELEETKKKLGIIKEETCKVCTIQGGRKKTRRRKKSKHSKTARRGRSKSARRGRSKTV